jgi:integrase
VGRGGYPDRDSAVAALQEVRCPVSRSDAPGTVSTGGWLRTWLGSRVSLAPAAAKAYGFHIRLHLEPALGRIPLRELRGGHVQEMFNRLAKGGKHRCPLSPSTLERIRVTLRVALNAAIREGLIEHNPALYLEMPRPRKARAVIWTEDQVEQWQRTGERPSVAVWTAAQTARFLHSAREHRLYAAFHLVALRGLRRAETAGSRWCDIDLDNRVLMVTHTIQRINERLMHCPPKTRSSRRMVVLDRATVKELRRHKVRQQEETVAAGNELKVIQDQFGHASIVLTADTYVSVEPNLARKAAESTARLVLRDSRYVPGTRRVRRAGAGEAARQ